MLRIKRILRNLINSKQYYNNYYEKAIVDYKEPATYSVIYDNFLSANKNTTVKTTETINHFSNIEFGSNIKTSKRLINCPYRVVKNKHLCDIIFYKTKIGNHQISIELHFFKKKLIFFKYTFPTTFYKDEIINKIKNKYFNKDDTINVNNHLIVDPNNNYLKITNEVTFSIYYMSTKFNFYNYIKDKKEELRFKTSIQKEFALNQLIDRI